MKLDDLKNMNIPRLAPIEVEYSVRNYTEVRRYLGYFKSIEEEKHPVMLAHYNSPDSSQFPEQYGCVPIKQIRSVTILVPGSVLSVEDI